MLNLRLTRRSIYGMDCRAAHWHVWSVHCGFVTRANIQGVCITLLYLPSNIFLGGGIGMRHFPFRLWVHCWTWAWASLPWLLRVFIMAFRMWMTKKEPNLKKLTWEAFRTLTPPWVPSSSLKGVVTRDTRLARGNLGYSAGVGCARGTGLVPHGYYAQAWGPVLISVEKPRIAMVSTIMVVLQISRRSQR